MPRPRLQFIAFAALAPAWLLARDASNRIGVMTHFAHGWDLDLLPRLVDTGVRHVRDEIFWEHVETAPGRFEFPPRFDAYMAALRERDVRPLVPLTFENPHHDDGLTPHTDAGFDAYARYAVEVVRRYGDQIRAVEIWNEYNGGFAKGPATKDRVATYTKMLRKAYAALKRERPDLVVLGGSTAGLPFPYIERLAAAGALDSLDALSIHPYRDIDPPETLEPAIRRLQNLLARASPERPIPIWVTEIGWSARPPGVESGPGVDETTQAAYLVRALSLLLSLGVEKAYWYQLREHGVDKGLGLLRADKGYAAKPAYAAFATLLAQLKDVRAVVREPAPGDVYCLRLDRDDTDAPARLLWSLRPRVIPSGGAKRLVRINGAVEDAPGEILLTPTPLYLLGAAEPPPAPEAAPAPLADSEDGFTLRQGDKGWSYGTLSFVDGEAPVFTPAEKHRVTDWKEEWILPGSPWSVSAAEQHPALVAGLPVAAVRRWVSPQGGPVRIRARFAAGPRGDGVRVRVLADGRPLATRLVGGPHRQTVEFELDHILAPSGALDFAVDPGPDGSPDYDATRVAVSILPSSRP